MRLKLYFLCIFSLILILLPGQVTSESGVESFSGSKDLKVRNAPTSPPRVVIEEKTHRFGVIFEGHPVEHGFIIMNAGDSPLLIRKVGTS